MNKPLKFSSAKNRIYVCSDLHLGHNPQNWDSPPLWSTRGFKSIEEHDAWIKDQWFKTMDDTCLILNLGDPCFSDPKGERFRQLTTWPGEQRLVNGNHYSGQRQIYRDEVKHTLFRAASGFIRDLDIDNISLYPLKVNNLTFMGESMHMWIDGLSVYCQHYAPYLYPEIGSELGIALCGHSHRRCPELNPEDTKHGRVLDCSVDNAIAYNQTPFFSWEDIKRIMATKSVVKRDHH